MAEIIILILLVIISLLIAGIWFAIFNYAYLDGEIDHHTASVMRNEIDSSIEKNMPSMLILDFRDVTFMDSSGIGFIIGRYNQLKK